MVETKKRSHHTRKKKKTHQSICTIPIQVPALTSSYNNTLKGKDFYTWVNHEWLHTTKIPPFENDFSVSEEVERCISEKSKEIIMSPTAPQYIKDLAESSKHTNEGAKFLYSVLLSLACLRTEEDVHTHFAQVCKIHFPSIFKLTYKIEADKTARLCIDVNAPGLYSSYYDDPETVKRYKTFLHNLGKEFQIPEMQKIYGIEKNIVMAANNLSNDEYYKIKGYRLERKFPAIPWKIWFNTLGLNNWRKMTLYYTSPRWIRYIGRVIREVPISYWKLYLAKCYIVNSLSFLPSPYNELYFDFFGKTLQGQKEKSPSDEVLVKVVHNYLPNSFSKLFWESINDPALVSDVDAFIKTLVESAKHRIKTTEWLQPKTREAAIQKVSSMIIEAVRPHAWAPEHNIALEPNNFLKNIFTLGEITTDTILSRINEKYVFWDEGIYRVNAYYFNENNQMLIPYGTCVEPFFIKNHKENLAWNYGGLGCIIGHEMCHGFDEDGKEYNEKGEKKRWWTRSDNIAYNKKIEELVHLYSKQIVAGHHIDGEQTLSENIADLAGVGIALQALKDALKGKSEIKEEYKKFFISFAISWRTKYRNEKLKSLITVDSHSPAFLRVNLVVQQFDEWYEAFDIRSDSKLYIAPGYRIRIF